MCRGVAVSGRHRDWIKDAVDDERPDSPREQVRVGHAEIGPVRDAPIVQLLVAHRRSQAIEVTGSVRRRHVAGDRTASLSADIVDEAIRLFLASTMDAVTQGEGQSSKELMEETNRVEDELRRRMPIGWQVNLSSLKREFVDGKGYSEQSLARALHIMAARETIRMRHGGSVVFRAGA